MYLINLVITIALVGLVVWAITKFIPMPETFKTLIYVIAGVFMVLYLLSAFGLYHAPVLDHRR